MPFQQRRRRRNSSILGKLADKCFSVTDNQELRVLKFPQNGFCLCRSGLEIRHSLFLLVDPRLTLGQEPIGFFQMLTNV